VSEREKVEIKHPKGFHTTTQTYFSFLASMRTAVNDPPADH
jgi:hypothetical protein